MPTFSGFSSRCYGYAYCPSPSAVYCKLLVFLLFFGPLCSSQVLFVAGARKTACKRHRDGWFLVSCKQWRLLLSSRSHRQSLLRDDFHRSLDRNPYCALRPIDPRVVIEEQVLTGVKIGHILIAVIGLYPRSGKILRHLRDFVLQLGTGRHVAKLANLRIGACHPLGVRTVFLVHLRIDEFAQAPSHNAAHRNEDHQRGEEDDNAGDTDIALLVAGRGVDILGTVRAEE